MLSATTAAARERGATYLRISGRAQGYAAPGVDANRDPGTARFLDAHGAVPSGAALAMHRTLHDLEIEPGEHHGRVVESGESAAVMDDPQHEYTKRLLAAAPNPAARLN